MLKMTFNFNARDRMTDPTTHYQITVCPRGCVRLHFGPALIHLEAEEFASFAAAVDEARRAVARLGLPAEAPRAITH